jgi:hypothetical protein
MGRAEDMTGSGGREHRLEPLPAAPNGPLARRSATRATERRDTGRLGRWLDRAWLPAVLTGAIVVTALVHAQQIDREASTAGARPSESLRLVSLETAWRAVRPAASGSNLVAEHLPVEAPSRLPASRRPFLRTLRDAAPMPTAALQASQEKDASARSEPAEPPLRRSNDFHAEEAKAENALPSAVKEATAGPTSVKPKLQRKATASGARSAGPRASAGPKGPIFSQRARAPARREAPIDDLVSLIEPPSPTIQKVSLQSP